MSIQSSASEYMNPVLCIPEYEIALCRVGEVDALHMTIVGAEVHQGVTCIGIDSLQYTRVCTPRDTHVKGTQIQSKAHISRKVLNSKNAIRSCSENEVQ